MIVFEARNSYELLVSFLFGKYLMACDVERVAIMALNIDKRINVSALADCGVDIQMISAPRSNLGIKVLTTLLRQHPFKPWLVKRIFLFHEISPLLLSRLFGAEINVVEHGEINYRNIRHVYASLSVFHPYLLVKRLLGQHFVGDGRIFSSVYLKDPTGSPTALTKKVLPLRLETYYDALDPAEKNALSLVFARSATDFSSITAKYTLVTQPFSELGVMTETRKIEMYRSMINAPDCDLLIKPHPKETTDYTRVFPGATILDQTAPFELTWLAGLRNTVIYTVSSSVGRMPGMNVVTLGDSYLDEFKH